MKILLFGDNHFCESYSLINKQGAKYTVRLENQLLTLNWLERLAEEKSCDLVIGLGDFFDKAQLTDQELTALKEIKWSNIKHYFLVGNHESEENNLQYSSTKALECGNKEIVSETKLLDFGDFELAFLPYIIESDRKPLTEYFPAKTKKRVILSHNDISGIQFGPVVSKTGFAPAEFRAMADLTINGHLHTGPKTIPEVICVKNITGKDFGENAFEQAHAAILLDTDTLKYKEIENPYAFNFYKLDILEEADLTKLNGLKNNAVLQIKCADTLIPKIKSILGDMGDKIVGSRIIVAKTNTMASGAELDASDLAMDHLKKFYEICHDKIENTALLEEELAVILK